MSESDACASVTALFLLTSLFQGLLIFIDEFYFHLRRGLPRWERIGHPIDSLSFALPLGLLSFTDPTPVNVNIYVGLSVISCLCITKDEWVHRQIAPAFEAWLHAMLFVLHPVILFSAYFLWPERPWYIPAFFGMVVLFGIHQLFYWNIFKRPKTTSVNTPIAERDVSWKLNSRN